VDRPRIARRAVIALRIALTGRLSAVVLAGMVGAVTPVAVSARATVLTASGELHTGRVEAVAAPLRSGQVLIVGGGGHGIRSLRSAELFHPASDTFAALPA